MELVLCRKAYKLKEKKQSTFSSLREIFFVYKYSVICLLLPGQNLEIQRFLQNHQWKG